MKRRAPAHAPLVDPRLAQSGASHGFDLRESEGTDGVVRPCQVHSATVVSLAQCREGGGTRQADAVVSTTPATARPPPAP